MHSERRGWFQHGVVHEGWRAAALPLLLLARLRRKEAAPFVPQAMQRAPAMI